MPFAVYHALRRGGFEQHFLKDFLLGSIQNRVLDYRPPFELPETGGKVHILEIRNRQDPSQWFRVTLQRRPPFHPASGEEDRLHLNVGNTIYFPLRRAQWDSVARKYGFHQAPLKDREHFLLPMPQSFLPSEAQVTSTSEGFLKASVSVSSGIFSKIYAHLNASRVLHDYLDALDLLKERKTPGEVMQLLQPAYAGEVRFDEVLRFFLDANRERHGLFRDFQKAQSETAVERAIVAHFGFPSSAFSRFFAHRVFSEVNHRTGPDALSQLERAMGVSPSKLAELTPPADSETNELIRSLRAQSARVAARKAVASGKRKNKRH